MTAAELAGPRLAWLHLASRRAPTTLLALVGCGLMLRIALQAGWINGHGALAQQLPLLIEGTAAVLIAATTRNPFGESERTAGRRLPLLRLGSALLLTAAAVAALAASSTGARLPGGAVELSRNLAGLTGIGLLGAAALGGALAWVAPLAYTVFAEFTLGASWDASWLWARHAPYDLRAALSAGVVFVGGLVLITARGTRD